MKSNGNREYDKGSGTILNHDESAIKGEANLSRRERSRAVERVRAHGVEIKTPCEFNVERPHREVPSHLSRRERFFTTTSHRYDPRHRILISAALVPAYEPIHFNSV
jgi:hypothetical protein